MSRTSRSQRPYLDSATPLAFAHRGGASTGSNVGIENTLAAFTDAYDRGYRYLETDVRRSADDVVYALHDETLHRVTGDPAAVASLTAEALDAQRLDGRESPARLEAVYAALPDARLNIDLKSDDVIEPTCALIEALGVVDRTCLASFSHRRLQRVRRRLPGVATSASSREAALVKLVPAALLKLVGLPKADCLQVPAVHHGIRVVTPRFVRRARSLGLHVHVWTVDDSAEAHRLLDLGVDGIITDRTDVLKDVLVARGTWKDPS